MNRHQRRAAVKQSRTETIRLAMAALASAGPTATGATLMMPDGEILHLDAVDARILHSQKAGGDRQS